MSFRTDGTHDGARPEQNLWGGAPYGTENLPPVPVGELAERNRKYYNIGATGGAMPTMQVDLACHHVVGWDIIWNFWNAMITNEAFLTARSYLSLFGAAQGTTSQLEMRVKNKQFHQFADRALWGGRMCWHPNNIVRGPATRSDDPNTLTQLEDRIDFQKAKADSYGGRVSGLIGAGRSMCEYIRHGKVEKADKAIQHFRSLRNAEIMEWDEDMWAVDSQHPGYSSTPAASGGNTIVRPRWRIHISKH